MAEPTHWAFPTELQPRASDLSFDLARTLDSVVLLRAEIPDDAFTAPILGTERIGNGVVIGDDGLILTIGYLITEAETIWLTTNNGAVVAGHPLAYDFATGFGLVTPLGRFPAPALPLGSSKDVTVDDEVFVVGHGGRAHALRAKLAAKREFAGYWEYLLDEALYSTPPHPQWGGAALVDSKGLLLGIGSLLTEEIFEGKSVQGNMFVPIDLLSPIMNDLLTRGASAMPPRPWLGMYTAAAKGVVVVGGLVQGGPADSAGIRLGDTVQAVGDEAVGDIAALFRKVWGVGPAGSEIPLRIARESEVLEVTVHSADRADFLKKPSLQ